MLLENLAKKNGNTLNVNRGNVINFVSHGVRIVPNNIVYSQHGKVIQLDIGSPKHSILPFIDSMEYTIKLKSKYNLTLEESIYYYNKARSYYNTFEFGKLFDPPHNKAHGVLDDFISLHDRINNT